MPGGGSGSGASISAGEGASRGRGAGGAVARAARAAAETAAAAEPRRFGGSVRAAGLQWISSLSASSANDAGLLVGGGGRRRGGAAGGGACSSRLSFEEECIDPLLPSLLQPADRVRSRRQAGGAASGRGSEVEEVLASSGGERSSKTTPLWRMSTTAWLGGKVRVYWSRAPP